MSTHDDTQQTGGLLSREDVAKRFSCSTETVKRLEKRGKLPRIQLGERAVRYRMADVLAIENGRVGKTTPHAS